MFLQLFSCTYRYNFRGSTSINLSVQRLCELSQKRVIEMILLSWLPSLFEKTSSFERSSTIWTLKNSVFYYLYIIETIHFFIHFTVNKHGIKVVLSNK